MIYNILQVSNKTILFYSVTFDGAHPFHSVVLIIWSQSHITFFPWFLQVSVSYGHMAEYLSSFIYLPAPTATAMTPVTHKQPLLPRCLL